MILVGSSVWIDYFAGAATPQAEKLDRLLGREPLAIGDLILVEVLQGFNRDSDFNKVRRLLTSFPIIRIGGPEVAVAAARNFRYLRKRGVAVRKTIDTMIATRCIESGHALLHSDRDFNPFVERLGLRVV